MPACWCPDYLSGLGGQPPSFSVAGGVASPCSAGVRSSRQGRAHLTDAAALPGGGASHAEMVKFTSMHTPCFVGTPGMSEDRVSPGPLARVPGGLRAQGRGGAAGPAGILPPFRLGQPSAEQSAQSQASSLSETWCPGFGRRGLGFQTFTALWFPRFPGL